MYAVGSSYECYVLYKERNLVVDTSEYVYLLVDTVQLCKRVECIDVVFMGPF